MATQAITLDKDAFGYLVAEHKLQTWSSGGYTYTALYKPEGVQLYRVFENWDGIPTTLAATADPAAGADPATITVPAGKRWKILALYNQMVSSADVANRTMVITITDGTNTWLLGRCGALQTASLTCNYVVAPGLPVTATIGAYNPVPIPSVELPAGYTVRITYSNIQAADNAGAVWYQYKEIDR